jgi:pterin-4a-carbinolamine dehydratase
MSVQYVVQVVDVVRPKIRRRPDIERALDKLKAERVEQKLREIESWLVSADGTLVREKRFANPVEAVLYLGFIQTLAAFLRIPVAVFRCRSRVMVHLHGGKTNDGYAPISDEQLRLAVLLS